MATAERINRDAVYSKRVAAGLMGLGVAHLERLIKKGVVHAKVRQPFSDPKTGPDGAPKKKVDTRSHARVFLTGAEIIRFNQQVLLELPAGGRPVIWNPPEDPPKTKKPTASSRRKLLSGTPW